MHHPWQKFVDDFWVPRGCLGCRIEASPVAAVSFKISESLGAVWAVESMHHPWKKFVEVLWVSRGCLRCWIQASLVAAVLLMISESLGLFGLSNPCVTPDSSSLMISESLGVVWAVETMRHRDSSFVDDFSIPRGCLGCRIHASPVTTICFMISESLVAVCAVESKRHPWPQFVDDFWVPRGCLGCRIHLSPVTAARWLFLSP